MVKTTTLKKQVYIDEIQVYIDDMWVMTIDNNSFGSIWTKLTTNQNDNDEKQVYYDDCKATTMIKSSLDFERVKKKEKKLNNLYVCVCVQGTLLTILRSSLDM